jgi:GrpB-like predicted nucleotidyltransferase (UPF0157 family)
MNVVNFEETVDFLMASFDRLASEVGHRGNIARYVQYQSRTNDGKCLHFLGLQVDEIDEIQEGMVAWELSRDTWIIHQPRDTIWQGGISWQWLNDSVPDRVIGEFTGEWRGSNAQQFEIVTNSYFCPNKKRDDDVHLVEYDPSWPERYEEMAERLREVLGPDIALRVEHYGSTAVPGMTAKPVIDVMVEIPSFAEARKRAIPAFNKPECEYWWYRDHMCFIVRDAIVGKRTHHIHMAPAGHRIWDGLIFRDYLKCHPDEASRYAALKHELAEKYRSNREDYTEAKGAFVQEITAKALDVS